MHIQEFVGLDTGRIVVKAALESPFCTFFILTSGFFLLQLSYFQQAPRYLLKREAFEVCLKTNKTNTKKCQASIPSIIWLLPPCLNSLIILQWKWSDEHLERKKKHVALRKIVFGKRFPLSKRLNILLCTSPSWFGAFVYCCFLNMKKVAERIYLLLP